MARRNWRLLVRALPTRLDSKSIHWSSYEAFPGAEQLFQWVFAAEDPAPLLLHILKEHPTYFTLRDLVSYFIKTVHNVPYRCQTLTSALAKIIHSPDAPSFGRETLHGLLSRELPVAGTLFKDDYNNDIAKIYGPKNTFLLNSLLSGFSFKYKLTSSPEMYGCLDEGLEAPRATWFKRFGVRGISGRDFYTAPTFWF